MFRHRPHVPHRAAPARPVRLSVAVLVLWAGLACGPPTTDRPTPRPLVVFGIDGGEWQVIRQLWDEGRLPHLAALAEDGVSARLHTRYSASPVIWTTIATGKRPGEHGITDFVVPTASGDVPVSSTVRRVPAIWNMASRVGRKVAVLGWWASWPAEDIHGVVLSDRLNLDLDHRFSPVGFAPRLDELLAQAEAEPNAFGGNDASRWRDHRMAIAGRQLVGEGYDLLLIYFRGVDIASHNHWQHYRPDDFPQQPPDPAAIAASAQLIPREYEAVDAAIGRVLAAAPEPVNVVVLSDHGFQAAQREIVKVGLDFDDLLLRLGYLRRQDDGGVDFAASRLYSFASPRYRASKWLRFPTAGREPEGAVPLAEHHAIRAALAADLARITYAGGAPAFALRDATPKEERQGADCVVEVRVEGAGMELLLDGDPAPLAGLVHEVSRVSGTHGENTHGILLAAGPDIEPTAELDGIRIHDIAPTLLYGMGLPVAEDFAGRAWVELFDASFRRRFPLHTVPTWGVGADGSVTTSAEDEALVRELRALGYLD